jgi:uncharacterized protein (DUF2336 family)
MSDGVWRLAARPVYTGVRVLNLKELLQFAKNASESGQQRLAEAVAQFFDTKNLSEEEVALATNIVLNLFRQAEQDLRKALAEKLSAQDNVPAEVVTFLANDVISVARPVLLHSPVLNDADLTFIITSKNQDYWRSIAERSKLSPVVADRLIETQDTGTVLNLIDNQSLSLPKASVKKMVRLSFKAEKLQEPLLRRREIDSDLATELYMCASSVLKEKIVEQFKIPPSAIEKTLENLIREFSLEAKGLHWVTPEMMMLAKRANEKGGITPDMMVNTLRRKQLSFFIALFAEKTGLDPDKVVQIVKRESGQRFAVACRSIGIIKSEFAMIFLLSRSIKTEKLAADRRELAAALETYNTLKDADVKRIMKIWTKKPDDNPDTVVPEYNFFSRRAAEIGREPSPAKPKEGQPQPSM